MTLTPHIILAHQYNEVLESLYSLYVHECQRSAVTPQAFELWYPSYIHGLLASYLFSVPAEPWGLTYLFHDPELPDSGTIYGPSIVLTPSQTTACDSLYAFYVSEAQFRQLSPLSELDFLNNVCIVLLLGSLTSIGTGGLVPPAAITPSAPPTFPTTCPLTPFAPTLALTPPITPVVASPPVYTPTAH